MLAYVIGALALIAVSVVWALRPKFIDVPFEEVSPETVELRMLLRVPPKAWVLLRQAHITGHEHVEGRVRMLKQFWKMRKFAPPLHMPAFSTDGMFAHAIYPPEQWMRHPKAPDWYIRSDLYLTLQPRMPAVFANAKARM